MARRVRPPLVRMHRTDGSRDVTDGNKKRGRIVAGSSCKFNSRLCSQTAGVLRP
jgi:hypothetical protein